MNIFSQARRTLGQPDPNFGAPLDTTKGTILYVEGISVSFDRISHIGHFQTTSTIRRNLLKFGLDPSPSGSYSFFV